MNKLFGSFCTLITNYKFEMTVFVYTIWNLFVYLVVFLTKANVRVLVVQVITLFCSYFLYASLFVKHRLLEVDFYKQTPLKVLLLLLLFSSHAEETAQNGTPGYFHPQLTLDLGELRQTQFAIEHIIDNIAYQDTEITDLTALVELRETLSDEVRDQVIEHFTAQSPNNPQLVHVNGRSGCFGNINFMYKIWYE